MREVFGSTNHGYGARAGWPIPHLGRHNQRRPDDGSTGGR